MADWYVSSVAYAAIPAFAATTAYTVGQIIRPTAAGVTVQNPQRCTTAGTTAGSEPSWSSANNGTTNSGTAVFTNVGGQSTYGWGAACGSLQALSQNAPSKAIAPGDRVFVSSDHSDTGASNYRMHATASYSPNTIISVNRAGSTPPVAADISAGAVVTSNSGALTFDAYCPTMWQGFTFTGAGFNMNSGGYNQTKFKDCGLVFTSTASVLFVCTNSAKVILDNTTMKFGATTQRINSQWPFDLTWINTPSAIVGPTFPTTLFANPDIRNEFNIVARGVDFSNITGTMVAQNVSSSGGVKFLFDSCKINASATKYATPGSTTTPIDEIEYVNCYDATNIFSSRYTPAGTLTTDTTTYMTGGAEDGVGPFSHKMVSNASASANYPLESFWIDVDNTVTGSSKTATIEIVSSGSLNNVDVRMLLEYEATSGSPVTAFADSLATTLTASAALTTSSAGWNSPPGTPVYQKIEVTFTPEHSGRVRAKVLLCKASATLWMNPQVTIS